MAQCLASKRRESTERCENRSLANFMYCGRHVKIKNVKPWIAWRPILLDTLVRIQAIWRGYLARKPLRLAGKGVLKRDACVNDEEMVTMESKHSLHPHEFFSLEEDGKVWFFEQKTIIQWAHKDLVVVNPYTRKQLEPSDMARIRNIFVWRRKNKMPMYHDDPPELNAIEKRDKRWMRVVQILREAGYHEIHHENFISLNYPQLAMLVNSMVEELRWWAHEKTIKTNKYFRWMINMRNLMHTYKHKSDLSSDIACILLTILHDVSSIHDMSFFIYTSYNRASEVLRFALF